MSDSEPEPKISIKAKAKKITPLGWEVELSEAHAQAIAEFVASPAYYVLKKQFVMQRRDQIARAALNGATSPEQLYYWKGMAAELVLLFKVLKRVKDAVNTKDVSSEDKKFKK